MKTSFIISKEFVQSLIVFAVLVTFGKASADTSSVQLRQKKSDLIAGVTKAVCYSGFRKGQHPDRGNGALNPSDKEILEDLRILSRNGNFKLIRLYDAGENSTSVLKLIKKHKLDIKVVLGAWLSAEMNNPGCPWQKEPYAEKVLEQNARRNGLEVKRAIRLAGEYKEIVEAVIVGNEALVGWTDHMVPVDTVIQYVKKVKREVSQPVSVADNYDFWAKHGVKLAKELDFVSVHIYPVWEEKGITEAIAYGRSNMEAVRKTLPDSQLVITEAGWATVASEFGGRAGEEQQQRYYNDLYEWANQLNITTFFFEAFDESWKGDPNNPAGAEKHWGLFTEDRVPKLVMKDLYQDLMRK